jgi:hypothetical protein
VTRLIDIFSVFIVPLHLLAELAVEWGICAAVPNDYKHKHDLIDAAFPNNVVRVSPGFGRVVGLYSIPSISIR